MTAIHDRADATFADLTERLMAEYESILPYDVVSAVAMRSKADLSGQVIDGAFPEMLLRLARSRLAEIWQEQL